MIFFNAMQYKPNIPAFHYSNSERSELGWSLRIEKALRPQHKSAKPAMQILKKNVNRSGFHLLYKDFK